MNFLCVFVAPWLRGSENSLPHSLLSESVSSVHIVSTLSYQPNPKWTHAGGIVYRITGTVPEVLLVRAKAPPHDWVIPKGHIERGETAERAAQREIREEAGVEAEPVQYAGDLQFVLPAGKRVHSAYFVMRFLRTVAADEDREKRWCTVSEAVTLTPFENAREIIRAAGSLIGVDLPS